MKIKCLPEDFIVEEKVKIQFSKKPTNFLLFRINKKNITTFKAVNTLNRTLRNIFKTPVKTIFLGLKDKYSFSIQYFCSILPKINLNAKINLENIKEIKKENLLNYKNLQAEFSGFLKSPPNKKNLYANHFRIILRDIDPKELDLYLKNIETIKKIGVFLNYFDYQRVKVLFPREFLFSSVETNLKPNKNLISLHQLKELLEKLLNNVEKVNFYPNKEKFNYYLIKNREIYILDSLKFNIMLSLTVTQKYIDNFKSDLVNYEAYLKAYLKQNIMLIPTLENEKNHEKIFEIFEDIKEKKIFDRKVLAKIWNLKLSYQKDELNNSRYRINLEFFLEPGSYGTCLIKHIIPYPHFSILKYKPVLIR